MSTVAAQMPAITRVIYVFDREGDIANVFAHLNTGEHTGVVVRVRCDYPKGMMEVS